MKDDFPHLVYELAPESDRFHFYETLWKQVALDLLTKHISPPSGTLLDVGCGRGELLALAAQRGFTPTGIDTDERCLKLSAAHGRAIECSSDLITERFGNLSFDVVAALHVLEHLESPRQALLQMKRVARQYVLIAVPNLRVLKGLREREFLVNSVNVGHLQSWDHAHLRNLAERHCELELVEWGSDATILPVLSQSLSRVFGEKAAIFFETGIFRRLFPYHCQSVIGLFRPREMD